MNTETKKITLKDFMLWYFSDDNSEGITITDKAIDNLSEGQVEAINKLYLACGVIPKRLVIGESDSTGDYTTEEVELIKSLPTYTFRITYRRVIYIDADTEEEAQSIFEEMEDLETHYSSTYVGQSSIEEV